MTRSNVVCKCLINDFLNQPNTELWCDISVPFNMFAPPGRLV